MGTSDRDGILFICLLFIAVIWWSTCYYKMDKSFDEYAEYQAKVEQELAEQEALFTEAVKLASTNDYEIVINGFEIDEEAFDANGMTFETYKCLSINKDRKLIYFETRY